MIGRLLREQMQSDAQESHARVAERIAMREAGKQANREMMEAFAPLTATNIALALDWQDRRITELLAKALQ